MGDQLTDAGTMRILLVDDHAIVMDGIAALLAGVKDVTVVGKAADGHQALALLEKLPVDILVTDHSMEGMDGLMLVRTVKRDYPAIKIVVLTMHDEPAIVNEVLRAGVDSYILKKYTHSELQMALEVIKEGGQFWSPEINKILLRRVQPEANMQITDRELEVLKLLVNEMSSREIAEQLFISERTVETHRKNLLRKTNSSNVVGLIKYAHTHGLV